MNLNALRRVGVKVGVERPSAVVFEAFKENVDVCEHRLICRIVFNHVVKVEFKLSSFPHR